MKHKKTAAIFLISLMLFQTVYANHNTLGTYHWSAQPELHYDFENWLGREQEYVLDFLGKEGWYSIGEPYWLTTKWNQTKYKNKLILSVPMLPESPSDVTLAKGANGDYNKWFEMLGRHLVTMEMSDTIIRPGWEMNGGWYKWAAQGKEEDFAKFFANIVTAMRKVEGGNFKFFWNPAIGQLSADTSKCYPGDGYVDFIGLDIYDESWASNTYPIPENATELEKFQRWSNTWISLRSRGYGLDWLSNFANEHKKQIIIGEWGVNDRHDKHSGGDNPYFIQWMHDWLEANDDIIFAHVYFDVKAPDGDHELSKPEKTQFPLAAAKFKELFGSGYEAPDKPVTPVPKYTINDDFQASGLDSALTGITGWGVYETEGGKVRISTAPAGDANNISFNILKDDLGIYAAGMNIPNGQKLILALYGSDYKLKNVVYQNVIKDSYNQFSTRKIQDYSDNDIAKAFLWDAEKPVRTFVEKLTKDLPIANKCLRLSDITQGKYGNARVRRTFAAKTGIVTLESDIWVDTVDTVSGPLICDSKGNEALSIQFKKGYEILHAPDGVWKSVCPIVAGKWYHIKAVIDTDSDTYDIYVDDVKTAEQAPLKVKVTDISSVVFANNASGTTYIDNIQVY